MDQYPTLKLIVERGNLLAIVIGLLPFLGALLKKEQDVDALSTYDSKGGRYPKKWEELGPRYNQ